jgi:hypothetical protein
MEYEFKLTPADAHVILNALGNVPLRNSLQTFMKVKAQLDRQDAAAAMANQIDAQPAPGA